MIAAFAILWIALALVSVSDKAACRAFCQFCERRAWTIAAVVALMVLYSLILNERHAHPGASYVVFSNDCSYGGYLSQMHQPSWLPDSRWNDLNWFGNEEPNGGYNAEWLLTGFFILMSFQPFTYLFWFTVFLCCLPLIDRYRRRHA